MTNRTGLVYGALTMSTDLITVSEAAEILGVDAMTVRRWGDRGELRMTRLPGGHRARRFVRAEIEAKAQAMTADLARWPSKT